MLFVWLDWIGLLSFILDYGLVHTWFPQTTHKSNVQWISISFVRLYVFKCDLCILNCLMIKPRNIFECFMCFWKWFLSLWSLIAWCQIFSVKKFCFWPFRNCFHEWPLVAKFLRNFNFLKISGKEFHESLVSSSRLRLDSLKFALCICRFHK